MEDGDDHPSDGLDERYVAAFDVVRSEARVDILLALAERASADPDEPALSFSTLHDRVDIADSGQFNYHLDKLRGHLVTETEDGYRLSSRGHEVVGAIVSGAFAAGGDRGPERIDGECPYCGGGLRASYEDGHVDVTCEAGHSLFGSNIPHEVARDASLSDALSGVRAQARYHLQIVLEGTCHYCYGDIDWSVNCDHDHPEPILFEGQCTRCGVGFTMPAHYAVLFHPAVVAFFWEQGVDVREIVAWEVADWTAEQTVLDDDPLRLRVTFRAGDARLAVTADETATVLESERLGDRGDTTT